MHGYKILSENDSLPAQRKELANPKKKSNYTKRNYKKMKEKIVNKGKISQFPSAVILSYNSMDNPVDVEGENQSESGRSSNTNSSSGSNSNDKAGSSGAILKTKTGHGCSNGRKRDDDDDDDDRYRKNNRKCRSDAQLPMERPPRKKAAWVLWGNLLETAFKHIREEGEKSWFDHKKCSSCSIMKYFLRHIINCTSRDHCGTCWDFIGACSSHMENCKQRPRCIIPFCNFRFDQRFEGIFGEHSTNDDISKSIIQLQLNIALLLLFSSNFLERLKTTSDIPQKEVKPIHDFEPPKDEAPQLVSSGQPAGPSSPTDCQASTPQKSFDLQSRPGQPASHSAIPNNGQPACSAIPDSGQAWSAENAIDLRDRLTPSVAEGNQSSSISQERLLSMPKQPPPSQVPFNESGWTRHLDLSGGDTGLRLPPQDTLQSYGQSQAEVTAALPPQSPENTQAITAYLRDNPPQLNPSPGEDSLDEPQFLMSSVDQELAVISGIGEDWLLYYILLDPRSNEGRAIQTNAYMAPDKPFIWVNRRLDLNFE